MELIMSIIGFGMDIIVLIMKIVIAFIVVVIAAFKGRNPLGYGLFAFFFPFFIFIMPFIPRKVPKLSFEIRNHPAFKGKNPIIASIMALSAIVAKSDGTISKEEVNQIKQFIRVHFQMRKEELNSYADAFTYGKDHPELYQDFAQVISGYYINRQVIHALAFLFVGIIMKDGQPSPQKEEQLRNILGALGLSVYEYQSLKASYARQQNYEGYQGYEQNYYRGQGYSANSMSESALIKKYSQVLGVSEEASLSEIKKAYRKLAKEYHPDKFASEGMPEEYTTFANQKISEINEAYEYLKNKK